MTTHQMDKRKKKAADAEAAPAAGTKKAAPEAAAPKPKEIGGPKGPDPTRYGDWERKGRCVDF